MKATDLMIGDWVELRYTDYLTKEKVVKVVKVDQIRKYNKDSDSYQAWSKEIGNLGDVEHLFPIPLTAEILENNGARKSLLMGEQRHFTYLIDGFEILAIYDADFSYQINGSARKLKYVHELQLILNLLGIDKQIEL